MVRSIANPFEKIGGAHGGGELRSRGRAEAGAERILASTQVIQKPRCDGDHGRGEGQDLDGLRLGHFMRAEQTNQQAPSTHFQRAAGSTKWRDVSTRREGAGWMRLTPVQIGDAPTESRRLIVHPTWLMKGGVAMPSFPMGWGVGQWPKDGAPISQRQH